MFCVWKFSVGTERKGTYDLVWIGANTF